MGTYTLKHTGPEVDRALDNVTVLSETVDELAETVSNLASQAPGSSSGSGAIDCEPGKIFAYAGSGTPQGALLCNGQEVSRTTYSELFDTIGIRYGDGDGSTTFNLPNIASRTIIGESDSYALGATGGEEKHTLTVSEIPAHAHTGNNGTNWGVEVSMGFNTGSYNMNTGSNASFAVNSNTVAGGNGSHNNMQPYIVMRYFITTGKGGAVYGITPADYIVEWGVTDIWSWRKYASGLAECWGTITSTLNSSGSQLGYPYWSTGWYNLPFAFTDVPTVTTSANVEDQATMVSYVNISNSSLVVEASANASGSKTCEFHMMVKGKWKDSSASSGMAVGHFNNATVENDLTVGDTLTVNGRAYGENKVLWSGISVMESADTATLSEAVSAQPNGIVIIFSSGTSSSSYDNAQFHSFFIPKAHVARHPGKGSEFVLASSNAPGSFRFKYLYINDTSITGNTDNGWSGSAGAGVNVTNGNAVLRYVYGV